MGGMLGVPYLTLGTMGSMLGVLYLFLGTMGDMLGVLYLSPKEKPGITRRILNPWV